MATTTVNYGTDAAFTMTGIEDVDSSTTWIGGWSSASVSNSSDKAMDYLISGQFTLESANRTTGTSYIYVYAYAVLDDAPTWPDIFSSGTEGSVGAATVHSVEARDSGMRLLAAIVCNNTASAVFTFPPTSLAALFGGVVPHTWALWVTSNACTTTTDWCVSSGTTLYRMPIKYDV